MNKVPQNGVAGQKLVCLCCGGQDIVDVLEAPDRYHGRSRPYKLLRCNSCSVVWTFQPPPPEMMGEHYGPDYDRSVSAADESSPGRWLDRRRELLKHKTSGSILDLGCSSGGFLASLDPKAWKLWGVEMSQEVADKAKSKSGANIFVGDILDAPFELHSFDAITCFHVFEHLYHPREVLQKVSLWLKPGGVFYALMPNIDSAGARIFKSYWYALELPRHLYHFSPESLRRLAASVGLREVSLTTNREVFIEYSMRYIKDDIWRRIGVEPTPVAKTPEPGIPFKVVRKAFRLTLLPVLNHMAGLAGDGESIHAVFRKDGLATS